MNCLFQVLKRHKKTGSMPCDEHICPTKSQWLHSGWGKKAKKIKLANSISALSASYRTSDPYGIRKSSNIFTVFKFCSEIAENKRFERNKIILVFSTIPKQNNKQIGQIVVGDNSLQLIEEL